MCVYNLYVYAYIKSNRVKFPRVHTTAQQRWTVHRNVTQACLGLILFTTGKQGSRIDTRKKTNHDEKE